MWKRILFLTAAFSLCCLAACSSFRESTPSALRPFLTRGASITQERSLSSVSGEILRYSITHSRGSARAWVFPDGSVFWCETSTKDFTLKLPGFSAAVGTHINTSDFRSPFLVDGNGKSLLFQTPLARAAGTLDGTNYIACESENGTVAYHNGTATVQFHGTCADWWAYLTPGALSEGGGLGWVFDCTVQKFGDSNRMTKDGYYYKTPESYRPTGEDAYHLLPAAHIAGKLAHSEVQHANQIAVAMLDIQFEHYNEAGFIPTFPESEWLRADYGVSAGFYDTRFNTDVASAYLDLGRKLEISEFTERAVTYAEFLQEHAKAHGHQTKRGVLVEDYSHPNGNKPTHTSLNHQLAEILFLLEVGSDTSKELAQTMLYGIEDTATSWVREDQNLHYAYYPDGSFGGVDYPYLTYNDLLALDRYLGGNAALKSLMDEKRSWMDENGITEYEK